MGSKKKRVLSLIFFLCMMAGVLTFILWNQDMNGVWAEMRRATAGFVLAGAFVTFLFVFGEAIATRVSLRPLGNKVTYAQCLVYSFIGFYFSAITPSATGGQPAQVFYMNGDGIPVSRSTLALLLRLIIYQFLIVVFAMILFLTNVSFVSQSIQNIKGLFIFGIAINVVLITFLMIALFSSTTASKFLYACIRLSVKLRICKDPEKMHEKIDEQMTLYREGAVYFRTHPLVLLKIAGACMLQILAMASVPYFVYRSFGLSEYSLYNVITIQTILNLSISFLPLPGAMGAAEEGFMIIFGMMFGPGELVGAMLVYRFVSFYFYFIVSSIVVLLKSVFYKKGFASKPK